MSGGVVHVNSGMPYDVYVGRAVARKGLEASVWQNPYRIGVDGTREQVLAMFERHMRALLRDTPGANPAPEPWNHRANLVASLIALRGKTLACWCAPKDRALTTEDERVCHGQILLMLAKELG